MGALLGDAAVVEDDDPAGVADRREAVGDDDRGAAGEQPAQARARCRPRCGRRRSRSPRRGSGCAGRPRPRGRRRRAGAGRPRAGRRARRPRCRSRPGSRSMNSWAPTARAASSIVLGGRVVVGAEGDVVADRAREQEALLRDDPELGAQRALASRRAGRGRRSGRAPRSGRRSGRRASPASTCRRRSTPTSATVWPGGMSSDTPSSASACPAPPCRRAISPPGAP